jgi:hypothetical protein
MSAALALRAAIRAALVADGTLVALLGGQNVYDDVPRGARPPYIVLADHAARDDSTGTEVGEEHQVTLHVWSRQGGLKQGLEIAEAATAALLGASLAPAGHRLVNLGWVSTDSRREPDGRHRFFALRFRAVTEPT